MPALRLILGDQLTPGISSLEDADAAMDVVLMCEVTAEATYVRHHKKKIAFLFAAMRHFAATLRDAGYSVRYTRLDDAGNAGCLFGEVARAVSDLQVDRVVVTAPGEYRLLEDMQAWQGRLDRPVEIRPDTRFLCTMQDFARWAQGRKTLRMEHFYREMRRRHAVLMDGDAPLGEHWNYDAENRKPPKGDLSIPPPRRFAPDAITRQVMDLVSARFGTHFGDLAPFHFAVTRDRALEALKDFIDNRLHAFGDYQDAMREGDPWMYHAHIGLYLNCGLLEPMECIRAVERSFHDGRAPINAVEGFIRQILGWREYVRGLYWLKMPGYGSMNHLNATRPLPAFYWTADTQMNCMRVCVADTRRHAYAHHIQRLMVLGNFALLAGVDPEQVNEWFLIVYADAYEWVELPNVSGMALFADGGMLASKPYAASGAYIDRMSDYCSGCAYDVRSKNGPGACPFNYLYWDFLSRNRDRLGHTPRLAMAYRTYDRMGDAKKRAIADGAAAFLRSLDEGDIV